MKLIIRDLVKNFDNKKVLKGAGFTFEQGKIYGLIGCNGAGKTTLFNCISGEAEYSEGYVSFFDGETERSLENKDLGFAFDSPVLPEFLTGYEFVKYYIDINKDRIKEPKSIEEYLDIIGIKPEDKYRLIKEYSFGMKNKLQMLCLLISEPSVMLLDEPLASFDIVIAHEIKQLLKDIKSEHIIIMSTHLLDLARDLCDEIVILHNGVLNGINHEQLMNPDFEESVINILKSDEDGDAE